MEVRLLGPVELIVDGRPVQVPTAKLRALLAILVIHRGRVVSTARLIDELWDESPPRTAEATLHAYVSRLRKIFTSDGAPVTTELLIRRRPGYQLAITPDQVDTNHFQALVDSAQAVAEAGEPAEAVRILEGALSLWRGPALAEFADRSFARAEALALEDLRLTAVEQWVESHLRLGDHLDLVGELQRLTTEHPMRERLWGQLMVALYRSGRRGDALLAFQRAQAYLQKELGIEPQDELRALADAVLAQDQRLDAGLVGGRRRVETKFIPLALPSGLRSGLTRDPFVGRQAELGRLLDAWARTRRGEPAFVLVAGEPGIGKTRLVTEFALRASHEGATVLWGRCSSETAVSYRALAHALRDYVSRLPSSERPVDVGPGGASLARMVPGVRVTGHLSAPGATGPSAEASLAPTGGTRSRRYVMFEAVRHLLRDAADRRPMLLVLEDMQWADQSTLSLLEYLGQRPAAPHLMLVATARTTGLRIEESGEQLGPLGWRRAADRIELDGLPIAEIEELAAAIGVEPAGASAVRVLQQRTRGNPLFLRAFLDAARDPELGTLQSTLLSIPERLQQVIDRWVQRLTAPARVALEMAAIVGSEFSVDLLARALDMGSEALIELLDEAAARSLVQRLPGSPPRYAFGHDLIAESLYAAVPSTRRAELHRRVGAALAAMPSAQTSFAELSHHYRRAAVEHAERAVEYAVLAGQEAAANQGFAEACAHYETALEVHQLVRAAPGRQRCQILLALGQARLANYDSVGSRWAFNEAAELAVALDARAELAEALRGLVGNIEFRVFDPVSVGVLEKALAVVGPSDPILRTQLLAAVARALPTGNPRAGELAMEAVTSARRIGDPETLTLVLSAVLLTTWRPDNTEERLGVATELIHLASELGWRELSIDALNWRATALDQLGDVAAADRDLERFQDLATASRRPFYAALASLRRTGRALLAGHYDEAEQLLSQTLGSAGAGGNFEAGVAAQLFMLHWDRGRLADLRGRVAAACEAAPDLTAWRAALALACAETGDTAAAREAFEVLARDDFKGLRRDWLWLLTVALLTEVCFRLSDRSRAARLRELLLPYERQQVVLAHGVASVGAVARYLGLAEATLGLVADALGHFDLALELHRTWGAQPWIARTALDAERLLLQRGQPGDHDRAATLAGEARQIAARTGMSWLRSA
jgi:DNA-binding SARP family transcriptional activator